MKVRHWRLERIRNIPPVQRVMRIIGRLRNKYMLVLAGRMDEVLDTDISHNLSTR